ncbi:putative ferredoxin 2Fe-2S protein [Acidithiobacillus ferrooxidans ATCC 53993]|jgi:(2Fe-2S) ferredoxin|uniref:(2Fe-2S) ferredoxin domain-containing protein n=1 Tax=Acidithiobacillus ferrooxidans TaxID=920 RepID=UPI00017F6D0E|nr:ferredoxin [Acidithiobacillus ferrooxidans]ACH82471.1 putative ferredoxin 2Fe-2S protein [Acidithiobacillus ferrooxidans ATCC 53993]
MELFEHYYRHHIFFCTNKRNDGSSCANHGSVASHQLAKVIISNLEQLGITNVMVNSSGCLGRCKDGPVLVIYPDGIWYTFGVEDDVREIIQEHITRGHIVKRLRLNGQ